MKKLISVAVLLLLAAAQASAQTDFSRRRQELASGDLAARLSAVAYFSGLASEAAYSAMIGLLPAQQNPYVKVRIIEGLDTARSTACYAAVFSSLNDPNPHVRQAAVISLSRHPYTNLYMDKFRAMISSDPAKMVRMSLINSFSLVASSAGAAAIESALSDTAGDPDIRRLAILSLIRMRLPETSEMVRKYINDPDPEVKRMAQAAAKD